MLCSKLPLWPQPTKVSIRNRDSSIISKEHIYAIIQAPQEVTKLVEKAVSIFKANLPSKITTGGSKLNVNIFIERADKMFKTKTSERYSLKVHRTENVVEATVIAPTVFGARHALETMGQLIWFDSMDDTLNIVHDIVIKDRPKFTHRGLMVDTSRNWYPVKQLMKIVDGMAASKLNTFHLHLTDAVSFPIVLPSYPNFAKYGSYSKDMIYSTEDIKGQFSIYYL